MTASWSFSCFRHVAEVIKPFISLSQLRVAYSTSSLHEQCQFLRSSSHNRIKFLVLSNRKKTGLLKNNVNGNWFALTKNTSECVTLV
jgi:hypothetical protein